jgi:putative transposase
MPRPPRRIETGLIYHVINRGNDRRTLFRTPKDFQAFLDVLAEGLDRFAVDLLCWCVMPNHWHLVLRPRRADQLQRFMQWLTITHVRRHHGHHGRTSGHLYQGRYKHFCVEADDYFLTLCRYVEANALRARLVRQAQHWRWSSLRQRLSRLKLPPLCSWPVDRPANWTTLVNEQIVETQLQQVRESVQRERPLGSVQWVRRTARRAGLEQTLHPRGRPRRAVETLSARQRRRREKRRAVI